MTRLPFAAGLLVAFALQVALAGWVVGAREVALATGTEVRLAVEPVDPRDLLRGDYVVLTYAISRLPADLRTDETDVEAGDTVYVSLAPGERGWTATAIAMRPPEGDVVIRGIVRSTAPAIAGCTEACGPVVIVDYDIDRFFVPEGTGRALEALRNDQRLSVDAVLTAGGRAALKRLLVDGEVHSTVSLF